MTINKTGNKGIDKKIADFENQLTLPFWSEKNRAMPNHIGRSALFTPVQRGARAFCENEVVWSRTDVAITYTGLRLDEADADLWMQLLHHYRDTRSNKRIYINRSDLLYSLGKSRTSTAYSWLEDAMTRLQGSIKLKSKKYVISTPLLQKYAIDEINDKYYIQIDSQIAQLFSNQEFSLFDWKKRLRLKYALAKSLQRHIAASSQQVQNFTYANLLQRFKRKNQNIKYLKRDLKRACQELVEVKILTHFYLEDESIKVYKNKNISK
ncbi:MAG: hypothetical protein L3J59_14130 [Methylococcaceae bacterium]|nr:hypothetical protein [Methylococcaceae bacterium]